MKKIIDRRSIQYHTNRIAKAINEKHPVDGRGVVFICLLNGGFMFFSDLVKNITFKLECDFVRLKSYEGKNQGKVQLLKDIESNIENKHIYLIDDFLDTGESMKFAINHFQEKNPASISIATLLVRESSPEFDIPTYDGLMLYDEWVVGYGLNGEGGYSRNLMDIYEI